MPYRVGELGLVLGPCLRAQRDDVGQLAHRLQVAQRGQPREPERVEAVARQQRQVGLDRVEEARRAVMQQFALADRLDDERDLVLAPRPARPRGDRRAEGAVGGGFGAQGRRDQVPLGEQGATDRGQRAQKASLNAAAAASTVRSMCSFVCASDGNQASNWDGGG